MADLITWRTSSHSANGGNCVEIGRGQGAILVRDTKDRTGGTLDFPAAQWRSLLAQVSTRAGR